MKLILSLFCLISSIAFAQNSQSVDVRYENYRELVHIMEPKSGAYTTTSDCVSNGLLFNKESKQYVKTISKYKETSVNIVDVEENIVRLRSRTTSTNNTFYDTDSTITFISENNFVRNSTLKVYDPSGKLTLNNQTISEGEYKNGKIVYTKRERDGKPLPTTSNLSSSLIWLDKQLGQAYSVTMWENSNNESSYFREETVCLETTVRQ